jgi:membrane dipeptidase
MRVALDAGVSSDAGAFPSVAGVFPSDAGCPSPDATVSYNLPVPRLLVSTFLLALFLSWSGVTAQSDPLLDRARRLLKDTPIVDGHNDLPDALKDKAGSDPGRFDLLQRQPTFMTDVPRLREGGVGGQFWSVYVPIELKGAEAVKATVDQVDIVHRMVERYPAVFELALTAADVERIQKRGRIASLIGMEGGHSINNSLGVLRMFHRLGARYMTLTHNENTPWADAAMDTPAHNGLTPFGEQVVREMNRLGMIVDLSHVSPATMEAALRVTQAPVMFSHSSARALTDHPRDVPDSILAQLPRNGGIVMVTFVPAFISKEVYEYGSRPAEWRAANPAPRATLAQVADHIDHIKRVAGVDHVGLGGDFDGITQVVQGLEDVSTYPALIKELLRRGYTDDEIRKIAGRNILRVMRGVEETARKRG